MPAWHGQPQKTRYAFTVSGSATVFGGAANNPPVWQNVPHITFFVGITSTFPISGTYQSNNYVTDADFDTIVITKNNVFVQGVSWDGGKFTSNGTGSQTTVTGHILTADDGHNSNVTSSAFQIAIIPGAISWTSVPSVSFVEGSTSSYSFGQNVLNYNAATDSFAVTPGYSLPSWLSLSGTGFVNLTPNGNQVDADDFDDTPGIKIDVRRSGGTPVSSAAFGVTVTADAPPQALGDWDIPPYVLSFGRGASQQIDVGQFLPNRNSNTVFAQTGTRNLAYVAEHSGGWLIPHGTLPYGNGTAVTVKQVNTDSGATYANQFLLPNGLSEGVVYYIVNVQGDLSFQLSATQGGSAISLSGGERYCYILDCDASFNGDTGIVTFGGTNLPAKSVNFVKFTAIDHLSWTMQEYPLSGLTRNPADNGWTVLGTPPAGTKETQFVPLPGKAGCWMFWAGDGNNSEFTQSSYSQPQFELNLGNLHSDNRHWRIINGSLWGAPGKIIPSQPDYGGLAVDFTRNRVVQVSGAWGSAPNPELGFPDPQVYHNPISGAKKQLSDCGTCYPGKVVEFNPTTELWEIPSEGSSLAWPFYGYDSNVFVDGATNRYIGLRLENDSNWEFWDRQAGAAAQNVGSPSVLTFLPDSASYGGAGGAGILWLQAWWVQADRCIIARGRRWNGTDPRQFIAKLTVTNGLPSTWTWTPLCTLPYDSLIMTADYGFIPTYRRYPSWAYIPSLRSVLVPSDAGKMLTAYDLPYTERRSVPETVLVNIDTGDMSPGPKLPRDRSGAAVCPYYWGYDAATNKLFAVNGQYFTGDTLYVWDVP